MELPLPPGPGAYGQVGAGEQGGDAHSPSCDAAVAHPRVAEDPPGDLVGVLGPRA